MDWDDAYAVSAHIQGAEDFPPRWRAAAEAFRAAHPPKVLRYGQSERNVADLFLPEGEPRGLAIFVHGGFWRSFEPRTWSHLAAGTLARGWAFGMPCYTLCPDIRISGITHEVASAIGALADAIAGPVRLSGHSAGGHLVSRMICQPSPLEPSVAKRLEHVVSISGLHDLRPLLQTATNDVLGLDRDEAVNESPALQYPCADARVTCWVGADETPEFVRQNALLANIWTGLGAATRAVEVPERHHFDVIDALADPDSALVGEWLGEN